MRNLIIALILLLGVVFVFINIAEMQEIINTLQRGDWRFLVLALGVQVIWMVNTAASFRAVYRALGLDDSIKRLFLQVAAANFVNVVAPSAGMGGLAVFISEAKRRGASSARAAVAGGLVILLDYVAFLSVLALGLIVLFRRNNLNVTELIASGILVFAAIVLATIIYSGMRSADTMGRALAWMARQVNRAVILFTHREYLSEIRAHAFAHEAADGLHVLRNNPEKLLLPATLSLSGKVLMILILTLVFLAFKVPFSIGTLVGGFSIGYLFYIVSPTPAGIGVVEGALTLGLRSLNVPLGDATVIALVYRGITFWAPWFFGILAFRWLSHPGRIEASA